MKVTTLKRISLDGFASLADESEDEQYYEWFQNHLDKEKEALKTELLKLLKDSIDDVILRDIMLVNVNRVDVNEDYDRYDNLTGLLISFIDDRDGTLIAKWRIPLRRGSYLEASIDDNRKLHISYKRGA